MGGARLGLELPFTQNRLDYPADYMEDLVNVTPENYLQVITALVARLKRVEQHLNLIEPEVEPEAAPLPVDPVLEVVEELKQPNDEAEKRFVQLRTRTKMET